MRVLHQIEIDQSDINGDIIYYCLYIYLKGNSKIIKYFSKKKSPHKAQEI